MEREDFKVTLTGFHYIEDELPEPFTTCMVITKKGRVMIGHWEDGAAAMRHDPRGAFYDGMGGHFGPDYVLAWKDVAKAVCEKMI